MKEKLGSEAKSQEQEILYIFIGLPSGFVENKRAECYTLTSSQHLQRKLCPNKSQGPRVPNKEQQYMSGGPWPSQEKFCPRGAYEWTLWETLQRSFTFQSILEEVDP